MGCFFESCRNLIRNDRPESPTNAAFIVCVLALVGLEIYATQARITIPHFVEFVTFVAALKINKSIQDRKAGATPPEVTQ